MADATPNHELPTVLRKELQSLAHNEGLTPSKLEGTTLLSLVTPALGWTDEDTADAMCGLITHLVTGLQDEKLRVSARATLNLGKSPVHGPAAMSRQSALAERRGCHPDTVRTWWSRAATTLAQLLPAEIDRLNSDPQGWEAYGADTAGSESTQEDAPAFSFPRVENIWRLRGKVAIELLTFRTLLAHRDGIDRFQAKGWYFSDLTPESCEVVPLLNCIKGNTNYIGRGITLTDLEFAQPLMREENAYFAYRILIHSKKDMEPSFYHSVSSAGVKLLICRIQFDMSQLPQRVWYFNTPDEAQTIMLPPAGSERFLVVNRLGFAQHFFHECKHGYKCGIAWQWPND